MQLLGQLELLEQNHQILKEKIVANEQEGGHGDGSIIKTTIVLWMYAGN